MCLHYTGSPSRLVQDPILMTECPVGTQCAVEEDCALVVGEEASELIVGTHFHSSPNFLSDDWGQNICSDFSWRICSEFSLGRVWTIFTQPCMNPATAMLGVCCPAAGTYLAFLSPFSSSSVLHIFDLSFSWRFQKAFSTLMIMKTSLLISIRIIFLSVRRSL